MPSSNSHHYGFFPGERPPSRRLSRCPYPGTTQETPSVPVAFVFYIRDIETGLGHSGASFELFSLREATRQIARSSPAGRVSFLVAAGQPYMLMARANAPAHAANAAKYHVTVNQNGSAIIDGHRISPFVLYHSRSASSFAAAYSGNGGVGQSLDGGLALNEFYTVKPPKAAEISKTGHDFVCWNTAADGRGTIYLPGSVILMSKSITLYAQWTPSSPSARVVIYDPNGGEGGHLDAFGADEPHGAVRTAQEAHVNRPGCSLDAWNTKPDGSGATLAPGASLVLSANLSLYAQWKSI